MCRLGSSLRGFQTDVGLVKPATTFASMMMMAMMKWVMGFAWLHDRSHIRINQFSYLSGGFKAMLLQALSRDAARKTKSRQANQQLGGQGWLRF